MEHLSFYDEYPVENFHSILRAQTSESDDGQLLRKKAKALDGSKLAASSFSSVYATPKKYAFSRDHLEVLKLKAARFLVTTLNEIKDNLGSAKQVERPARKPKNLTYWKMPHLYGEDTVTSKILPLGFQFHGKEPNLTRYVPKQVFLHYKT